MRRHFFIAIAMAILVEAQGMAMDESLFVKVSHHRSQIRRSFAFNHRGFGERMDDVRLLGNAAVMADGSIQIPMEEHIANQAGRALFASPVRMWDPNTSMAASFETEFSFAIGEKVHPHLGDASGGGLAFIIVPDEISVGREAAFMGMLNEAPSWHLCNRDRKNSKELNRRHAVIAVEFDTFKDAEFGDPNDNHVGINLGSVVSDATADLANAGVHLHNASLVKARIVYDGPSQQLQVHVLSGSSPSSLQSSFPPSPILTQPIDLSGFLSEYMFVGFSAATGSESRSHSIFGWKFSCASHAVQRFPVDLQPRARGGSECNESMLEHEFEQGNKTRRPPRAFVIFLASSAVVILALVGLFILWHSSGGGRGKSRKAAIQVAPPLIPRPRPHHRPRRFELPEIVTATCDFDDRQRIGGGVYRAALQDGSMVVVKRLRLPDVVARPSWWMTPRRRERETFAAAMTAASKLRHPNLVPLRGWCFGRHHKMLVVYDYMPNGSLDKWLYPAQAIATLPWQHRWKVASDVAAALAHLHAQRFPHGRLKASNVLLDITFRARLGDYGLAFYRKSSTSTEFENIAEDDRIFSEDVAAFGVLLLELARGTRLTDVGSVLQQCREEIDMNKLVDDRLEGNYSPEQAACLLGVGLLCAQEDDARPSMDAVMELLDRIVPIFPSSPSSDRHLSTPVNASTDRP